MPGPRAAAWFTGSGLAHVRRSLRLEANQVARELGSSAPEVRAVESYSTVDVLDGSQYVRACLRLASRDRDGRRLLAALLIEMPPAVRATSMLTRPDRELAQAIVDGLRERLPASSTHAPAPAHEVSRWRRA